SSLSFPLSVADEPIGALNLYAGRVNAWDDGDEDRGRQLAEHAAALLANAQAHDRTVQLVEQLHESLASRAVIEQAKGILMARQGCSADAAFEILRRASQARNRKVR